jgi:ABC-type lipoprotein release transport system permease subunit
MYKFLEIARTGLVAILLHPLRSLVTAASLVAVLLPYSVGLAVSKGIQREAADSVRLGADLYVTGSQFGRSVPLPISAAEQIARIEGVTDVVPRIVGAVSLGKDREHVVVVGMAADKLPPSLSCVRGRLFQTSTMNEFVIGTELAERLKLDVGSLIPPFYRNPEGERVSEVVGVFTADVSIWQSRLILTSLDTAANIFDQKGQATDLLVYCRQGYAASVSRDLLRIESFPGAAATGKVRAKLVAREDLEVLLPKGLLHREGIFNLHFVLLFVVGILVVLVTSGVGLTERRREVGILKATGWQTDEILLRSAVESSLLGIASASISILLAFFWLRLFNGYWIASIFLSGVGAAPTFDVPFQLAPIPALFAFLLAFVLIQTGTIYSSWRAATVPPAEAMR